ncbi:hypothetical protein DTO166G4_4888 [Paecilomyces variotii]|nr:hypothetical protein DTO166G4_4888 [Paecilomyces variotii]
MALTLRKSLETLNGARSGRPTLFDLVYCISTLVLLSTVQFVFCRDVLLGRRVIVRGMPIPIVFNNNESSTTKPRRTEFPNLADLSDRERRDCERRFFAALPIAESVIWKMFRAAGATVR